MKTLTWIMALSAVLASLTPNNMRADVPIHGDVLALPGSFFDSFEKIVIFFGVIAVFMSIVIVYLWTLNAKLIEARDKFHTLFNSINIGILQLSPDKKILAINDKALEVFNISRDDAENLNQWMSHNRLVAQEGEFVPTENRPIFRALFHHEDVNDELFEFNDGSESPSRWYRISASRKHSPFGKECEYAFSTLYDVTDHIEAEKTLRKAEKMEVLSKVIAGLAHDFNNSLAIVQSNLEFLRLVGDGDEEIDQCVGNCLGATQRCELLTRNLLIFSREKHKSLPEDVTNPININAYLREFQPKLHDVLPPDIALKFKISPEAVYVRIEPSDFESIIKNIAQNAADAMKGRGTILISSRIIHDNESNMAKAVLSIRDNGEGIKKENLDKVFEPFFSTKDETKNRGLGLAMVYGFVKRAGGQITVRSEIGEGTSFDISFPCLLDEYADQTPRKADLRPENGSENILVIDDEEELLNSTCLVLEKLGYKTQRASSFEEAIQILENQNDVEIVLSDILLPGPNNGIDIANFVLENKPNTPIILISGQMKFYQNRAPKAPCIRTLQKPTSTVQLSKTIRELLDKERANVA